MNRFTLIIVALMFSVLGPWHGDSRAADPVGEIASASGDRAAVEAAAAEKISPADRGYRYLIETPLLTSDLDDDTFSNVWRSWPEPLRSEAEKASPAKRREMAFGRYGLTRHPEEIGQPFDEHSRPLQYVVGESGVWTMNCLACHGGDVYGTPTPGAPNNRFALQTMTEELRATKLKIGKPFSRMDLGALFIPLGTTHGTTNAVVFGMGLMDRRDADLNLIAAMPKRHIHHDMDAPPWWHFSKRPNIYIDGFAEKGHRGLMQFTLIPENGPEVFREREENFRDVAAYLTSLEPPQYPAAVDQTLAGQGRVVFESNCASCHGTYGENGDYPNLRIPLDEIGTDPVRLTALTVEGRQKYADSWFAHAGEPDQQDTVVDPDGYVAPPLDGVWASPPYLHNGSVPTLWHMLHPEDRPVVWRRVDRGLDEDKVGFKIEVVDGVPAGEKDVAMRRSYFDTRKFGKSADGHDYPSTLSESEKTAVLEYLKTL